MCDSVFEGWLIEMLPPDPCSGGCLAKIIALADKVPHIIPNPELKALEVRGVSVKANRKLHECLKQ